MSMKPSHVYVVMINTAIHSIVSDPDVAEKLKNKEKGATVHKFPLISAVDPATGAARTESFNPLAFLDEAMPLDDRDEYDAVADGDEIENTGDEYQDDTIDHDFDDVSGSGEYEDDFGDDMIDRTVASDEETDVVCMDIPLTLRLLEWAREEAGDDADLHKVAENLASLGNQLDEVLTMENFDDALEGVEGEHNQDELEFADDDDDGVSFDSDFDDDGDDIGDFDDYDDYTDDIDASGYSTGSDDQYDADPEMQSRRLGEGASPAKQASTAVRRSHEKHQSAIKKAISWMKRTGKDAEAAVKEFDLFVDDVKTLNSKLNEGVETFADFMADLPESGTTSVPSVKDIYKKKRTEKEKVYTRSEVKQKADDHPFVIADTTTDKK